MKMRKVLSFALILALVLGSISTSFAATDNTVAKVLTVASETSMPEVGINVVAKSVIPAGEAQKIKLDLTNAEWDFDTEGVVPASAVALAPGANVAVAVGGVDTVTGQAISAKSVEFSFAKNTAINKGDSITFKLNLSQAILPAKLRSQLIAEIHM